MVSALEGFHCTHLACQMASAQLKTEWTCRHFIEPFLSIALTHNSCPALECHHSTLTATKMQHHVFPPVQREGSGDLMDFDILSVANQTDGCRSLSYLILSSTSLGPNPINRGKGLITKARILGHTVS